MHENKNKICSFVERAHVSQSRSDTCFAKHQMSLMTCVDVRVAHKSAGPRVHLIMRHILIDWFSD